MPYSFCDSTVVKLAVLGMCANYLPEHVVIVEIIQEGNSNTIMAVNINTRKHALNECSLYFL